MNSERLELFLDIISELSQRNIQQVAKEAGVSPATLYRWLDEFEGTTHPRIDTLHKVGKALGMELQWRRTRKLKRVA